VRVIVLLSAVRTFAQFGVQLTDAEVGGPMGIAKRDHIQALGRLPRVTAEWQRLYGRAFGEQDTDALYDVFGPISTTVVVEYADPVPGLLETLGALRKRGIKIGSTTGYSRAIAVASLMPTIDAIEPCLAQGQRPAPLAVAV
jgi:phosphonoacetaldehyde hydrolase